ncbi:hypothetical protein DXG03_007927 [Asterophora parasitica]|uniref:Uncharacterized protein n=1 Tax=Asterophora parasitica TaxID=117018 RepID=A0A9P7G880_9AGAR|nr:hypothetical protein DXG03_007927 [Asterophora parasitica]
MCMIANCLYKNLSVRLAHCFKGLDELLNKILPIEKARNCVAKSTPPPLSLRLLASRLKYTSHSLSSLLPPILILTAPRPQVLRRCQDPSQVIDGISRRPDPTVAQGLSGSASTGITALGWSALGGCGKDYEDAKRNTRRETRMQGERRGCKEGDEDAMREMYDEGRVQASMGGSDRARLQGAGIGETEGRLQGLAYL